MSQPLVLVTGVSGFLGSHVVDQLLKDGYRVRGTARSAKVAAVQAAFSSQPGGDRVEIVGIDDIISDDFTKALEGVSGVLHLASPLVGKLPPAEMLDAAVNGTLNVIRQAIKLGIKNFSVASSIGAVWDRNNIKPRYTSDDWNPITKEQVLAGADPFSTYSGTKTFAERAVWEFVAEHPDVNVTVLNPPFFIGPLAPGFRVPPGDRKALSTDEFIYKLLFPENKVETPALGFVDVRDVAIGLVRGQKTEGKHRIVFGGEWFTYEEAIEYIASIHPELKGRLATATPTAQKGSRLDISKAELVLNLTPRPWKESIHGAVEDLLELEKSWIAQGIEVKADGGSY